MVVQLLEVVLLPTHTVYMSMPLQEQLTTMQQHLLPATLALGQPRRDKFFLFPESEIFLEQRLQHGIRDFWFQEFMPLLLELLLAEEIFFKPQQQQTHSLEEYQSPPTEVFQAPPDLR